MAPSASVAKSVPAPCTPRKRKRPTTTAITSTTVESPYTGQTVEVIFGHATFQVHRGVIDDYLNLEPNDGKLKYRNMSKRQGHTIIHYLYTGTYQYLEPVEKSAEIDENKFIDTVKICDFAEKFGIDSLATLASKDIKKFGDGLKFSTIYKILSVHIPMFQHEYGELTYYLNVRANLEKEEITEGEINELQRVTSPDNLAATMAQNMLKMKLTVQKYKELYGPLPEDEDYEEE